MRPTLLPHEAQHLDALRPSLAECMVLLKSNGQFPLSEPCPIGLYGNGARHTIQGGTGSGEVNTHFFINAEEGLEEAGFTIQSKTWLDAYDHARMEAYGEMIHQIRKEAKAAHIQPAIYGMGKSMKEFDYTIDLNLSADTAIYVLARQSGEGNDRRLEAGDLYLTSTEIRDIQYLQTHAKRFMLVLNVCGPIDLSPILDTSNILVLSQLGTQTGAALGDVLLGKQTPSGKLTSSWYHYTKDTMQEFGHPNDTRYREGLYIDMRHPRQALFPFGYGCSYTTFQQNLLRVHVDHACISFHVQVRNTGHYSGKEVVQVYMHKPSQDLEQPKKELVGFAKSTTLAPNQSEEVSIQIDLRDHASFDPRTSQWVYEAGTYLFYLSDTQVAHFHLNQRLLVRRVRPFQRALDFEPLHLRPTSLTPAPSSMLLEIDPQDLRMEDPIYDTSPTIDPLALSLSNEALLRLNVGHYHKGFHVYSYMGMEGVQVPGAAGETAHPMDHLDLLRKKLPVLVMGDGPAGLRLARDYFKDLKGIHIPSAPLSDYMMDLLPRPVRWYLRSHMPKQPLEGLMEHQYCTAIPIETAIAQSWNVDFAKTCGRVVGEEMELYHVDFWLAPGLNLMRDVRCGRNFEYLSADPTLSGLMGAGIVQGVQSVLGKMAVIKHFCANNQEFNRYFSNSMIDERSLRELYLKPFRLCIKYGQPHALMTSYNLLNGMHTSQDRQLLQEILRAEFAFEGLLMTDWDFPIQTGKVDPQRQIDQVKIVMAGVSLLMPGRANDLKKLRAGMKAGRINRTQLLENVSYLIRAMRIASQDHLE